MQIARTAKPVDDRRAERLLRVVSAFVEETQPARAGRVALASRLEHDLGLDSLARVELLLRVGREFGAPLPDAALTEAQSAADLLRFVNQVYQVGQTGQGSQTGAAADVIDWGNDASSGVPEQATTLVEVLHWHAAKHPQRRHVVFCDDGAAAPAMSYGELLADANALAAGLVARGLKPGQCVALMLPTGRSYLASFFAVMLAGGVPVPIYPPARLAQIEDHLRRHAHILANAQTVFIVTVAQAKPIAALLRARVPELKQIVTPDELIAEPLALRQRAAADDIAFLQYTSGSTGSPKGVALSHGNLLANLRAMGEACRVSSADVFVSWLPLYHDMGLIGAWFGALYFAFPLVLMSPQAFLARPSRWLAAISRYRGTISAAPNFAYELCASKLTDDDLRGLDLSRWRLALNGAEPVSAATLDAFAERVAACGFSRAALTPVYGLAECSVGLAFPPLERGPRIDTIARETLLREQRAQALPAEASASSAALRVVACGRALPGHEIRIVDAAGDELPERQVGQLQFRGPSATRGYYRNAPATRTLIHQGWLASGDLAYCCAGEIYLTGRAKDLIIRGGRKLYPYELEQAVGAIAGLRKGGVAVFASNGAGGTGERLVVVAETSENDPQRRAALREQIGAAAIDVIGTPADDVALVPPHSVLKTSSGKIRRSASRDAYERGQLGAPGSAVWRIAARLRLAMLRAQFTDQARRRLRDAFAAWCWLVFALLALPVALLVVGAPTPLFARRLVHGAARLFFALCGLPVRRSGIEQLATPPLLLFNHSSYLDALLLCAVLPPAAGYVFVAKRELREQPLARAFLRGFGVLYVERYAAEKSAADVDAIARALQRGVRLIIFPEGTFSRETGLQPFHMGAFVAAARTGVALRVGALRGTREVLRDQSWRLRHGPLSVIVAEALHADGGDWAAAVRLRDTARRAMLQQCGEPDLAR